MAVTNTFQNYFYNSKKLYEFRIKIANVELTKDVTEAIKNALDAYEVETMSTPKRLPIQEHRDFGKLGPCEVHHIDVALNYPTIAEQVRQLVINRALVPNQCICVETMGQAQNEELVQATIDAQGAGGPIIDNPELTAPAQGDVAGQARVDSLLKELSKEPLSRTYEIAGNEKPAAAKELQVSTTSPVGSTQNTVYRKPKGNK